MHGAFGGRPEITDPFSRTMQTFARNLLPHLLFLPRHSPLPKGLEEESQKLLRPHSLPFLLAASSYVLLPSWRPEWVPQDGGELIPEKEGGL